MSSIIAALLSGQAFGNAPVFSGTVDIDNGGVLDLSEIWSLIFDGTANVSGKLKLKEADNSVSGSGVINILQTISQDENLKNEFPEIIGSKTAYSVTSAIVEGNPGELGGLIQYPEGKLDLGKDGTYTDITGNSDNFINLISNSADTSVSISSSEPSPYVFKAEIGSLKADNESIHPINISTNKSVEFKSNFENYDGNLILENKEDLYVSAKYTFTDASLPNITATTTAEGGAFLELSLNGQCSVSEGKTVEASRVEIGSESKLVVKNGGVLKFVSW